jgi:hypothetical protein
MRLLKFAYPDGQQVTAQQANLPPAVTLNVKERRLFSGVFGGEGLSSRPECAHPPRETQTADLDRCRIQADQSNVHVYRQFGQDLRRARGLHVTTIAVRQREKQPSLRCHAADLLAGG